MRFRNKPWAADYIAEHSYYCIEKPENQKGKWHSLFGNNNPIHIEVGTGKGTFITEMAKANPDINYIGIELFESVIVKAIERAVEADIPNIKLLHVNAQKLMDYFETGEVERVYLNFSIHGQKHVMQKED